MKWTEQFEIWKQDPLNFRKIPTPQYGNYGGAYTRCASSTLYYLTGMCPLPVDQIDQAFQKHDDETGDRSQVFADPLLVGRLLKVNPLGKYKDPVYGRLYHAGALVTFSVLSLVTVPQRSLYLLYRKAFKKDQ